MISQQVLRYEALSVADASRLSEVAIRAYCDHYLHLWHDSGAWYLARSFTPEALALELLDENARFYLIYLHEEPVGFLKLNLLKPSPCSPSLNGLELERIYLQQAATGKGIGAKIVQFVLEHARQMGRQVVWLKAMESSHDAIAFYERMGFVLCGTSKLSFEVMREEYRPMVTMQQVL
ncbi:GNAT family N-acetyltransferase [Spirosoma fluviale]|uniref:L-amino acid N-acyltransferase YncA n=1 Tax=Spirosoma fluviale TaxID=1597977 RepID=A0A286FEA7_9BACT|nr:GNAT family N-acetyltransferase [Spirosoma fluviale]SOD81575.1 L-amino acid N-acyltransferase YncA [Spirosoma fluviale]